MDLVGEFIANWFLDTQSKNVNVCGKIVKLNVEALTTLFHILNIDHTKLKEM